MRALRSVRLRLRLICGRLAARFTRAHQPVQSVDHCGNAELFLDIRIVTQLLQVGVENLCGPVSAGRKFEVVDILGRDRRVRRRQDSSNASTIFCRRAATILLGFGISPLSAVSAFAPATGSLRGYIERPEGSQTRQERRTATGVGRWCLCGRSSRNLFYNLPSHLYSQLASLGGSRFV